MQTFDVVGGKSNIVEDGVNTNNALKYMADCIGSMHLLIYSSSWCSYRL
jgi:hypothetical protein